MRTPTHITVDLIWANVGPRYQRMIDVFATLVLLFVTIVVFIGGQYLRFVILIGGYSRVILPIVKRYKGVRHPATPLRAPPATPTCPSRILSHRVIRPFISDFSPILRIFF